MYKIKHNDKYWHPFDGKFKSTAFNKDTLMNKEFKDYNKQYAEKAAKGAVEVIEWQG